MTDKEQIMIDKVDVSKCFWLWVNTDKNYKSRCIMNKDVYSQCTYCKDHPNCLFKQLARKTQECTSLKEEIEILQNNFDTATRDCNDEIEILKQECEELKKANQHIDANRQCKGSKLKRIEDLISACEAGYMIEDINTKGNYHQALLVSPDAYITCLDAIKDHEERLARLEKMHFTQVGE